MVEVSYLAHKKLQKPSFTLGVQGISGSCFTANMLMDGHRPSYLEGSGQITCTFRSIPLLPQNYTVRMGVRAQNLNDIIVNYQDVASFGVVGDLAEFGFRGPYLAYAPRSTPVVVP